jgi:hypothetical protein
MARLLARLSCAAAVSAVACSGGSPASPSAGGATIAGTVVTAEPAPFDAASSVRAMAVGVSGTALSTGVDASGRFRLGGVPAGNVELAFSGTGAPATISLANVVDNEVIELQVALARGTATVLNEVRGNSQGKVLLCHRSDSGYHTIDVSTNAEGAHRAHGDAKPGEPVPADPTKVFDAGCRLMSLVSLKKFTNGQDIDRAPGPTIPVGTTVTWTYVVTNNSALTFTSLSVTDDRGVAVSCPAELPPPGGSITCTGSGTAVAGQYRNVGTATATANGNLYIDRDDSFYFGGAAAAAEETRKVQLCHRTGNGSHHLIEVSVSAEPAHRAHGDAKVGEPVPGNPGRVFTAACGVL